MTKRLWVVLAVLAALSLVPRQAAAFCGFYVAGADTALHNHATTVVLMREGTRTVLSMQNDYAGPPEDFALVVPVPVVLQRDDVRTLDRALFERIERLTGPRLVEYWEEDPCTEEGTIGLGNIGTLGRGAGTGSGYGSGGGGGSFVHIEAQFAVGEYDIVVLGTNDSSALDTWLRTNGYHIPAGAAEALRPYVESGMKFFVARVDVDRVRFESGRAVLSPLRVHYESEQLSLPVRLGLLNSSGTQDLVVTVIARQQRFEVANYPNVFMPTNLEVSNDVRERFSDFYGALLDRTMERNPGAVVTEYAWQASSCDPCPPDATLDAQSLTTLGGDVLYRGGVQPGGFGLGGPMGLRRSGPTPTVQLDAPRVTGDLSAEVVRRVIRRHINELRFCFEQSLARQPSAAGSVDGTFAITSSGAVAEATVRAVDGTLPEASLACMQSALRRWAFPAPPGPVNVVQRMRFSFDTPAGASTSAAQPLAPSVTESELVVTRLHYRYGASGLGEDLVFRAAEPVIGGREVRNEAGALEEGATPSYANNFQARYIIRHPWEGPIACASPVRGRWGGPPGSPGGLATGLGSGAASVSVAPPHAARNPITLEPLVYTAVSALGLAGSPSPASAPTAAPAPATAAAPAPPTPAAPAAAAPRGAPPPGSSPPPEPRSSWGCAARHEGQSAPLSLGLLTLAAVAVLRRRRRSAR